MADHSHPLQPGEVPKPHTKEIWRTFLILLVITALEFVVAFSLPHEFKLLRVGIFVIMTLVKAFYIVAEFMHLKTEVKTLMYCIVIPLVFIVWLLIALLMEGNSILRAA